MSRVIHYRRFTHKNYRFILTAPLTLDTGIINRAYKTDWIELDRNGVMTLSAGYAWDGASGIAINTKNSLRASCGHDALYQLIRLGLLPRTKRLQADSDLRKWLIEDGMLELRAGIWFLAVRLFGELYLRDDVSAQGVTQ